MTVCTLEEVGLLLQILAVQVVQVRTCDLECHLHLLELHLQPLPTRLSSRTTRRGRLVLLAASVRGR